DQGINVAHIESRRSRRRESEYEIMVDIECDNSKMDNLTRLLQRQLSCLSLHDYDKGEAFPPSTPMSQESFGK
ncbi:hypothetical protein SK128_000945, partial [Halocaridina rubra]